MEYRQYSDYDLIAMAIKGNESAFSEIHRRHRLYVSGIVGKFIDNQEDRTEVVQDVFLKAFLNLHKFQFSSKFTTWIYTIASRESLNYLTDKTRYHRLKGELENHLIASKLSTYTLPTDRALDSQLITNLLHNDIEQDKAHLLNLYYLQDKTVDMISKVTGYTISNVKVKLSRARKQLKNVLTDHFGSELDSLRFIH